MKQIGAQFSDKQHFQIGDINDKTGQSKAMIARAAMQLGLKQLREYEGDQMSINEFIAIQDAIARN